MRAQGAYEADKHATPTHAQTPPHTHTHTYTHTHRKNTSIVVMGLMETEERSKMVIADKRATVQSTVVTKTCSSLISCSTIHELSVLHAWDVTL